jgi:hypothetical protein
MGKRTEWVTRLIWEGKENSLLFKKLFKSIEKIKQ